MSAGRALALVSDTPEVRRRKVARASPTTRTCCLASRVRRKAARRFRDLVNAFLVEMGGVEQCSEIKIGLLRRLAATTVQAELLEAEMVNGEGGIDVATLCTLASTTVRLSQRLGLERIPRTIEDDVSTRSVMRGVRHDADHAHVRH